MKILVSQLAESVLCTLPNGEQLEITMLSAEGEECFAVPDIQAALDLLCEHSDFTITLVTSHVFANTDSQPELVAQ